MSLYALERAPRTMLPPGLLWVALALFAVAGMGTNVLLAAAAMGVLLVGGALLWRPGETPILLFIFCFQWLQATISIYQANWAGLPVDALSRFGADMEQAIVLSLIGLLALAGGMRLGAGPWRAADGRLARVLAGKQRLRGWFSLYAAALLAATVAQGLALAVAGLSQPLLALASLKWAAFWILAYATFTGTGSRSYFLAAFCLELMLGLGGYFSEFKTVLFVTAFAFVASGTRLSFRYISGLAILGILALGLGLVWTAIKQDYRDYVSGGQRAQVVTVSYGDRLAKIVELAQDLDGDDLLEAADGLARRIGYVEFFGVVLKTVPRYIPHEGGAIWWDAVTRPFMPRILFPEKTAIDDSERTNYYTGLRLAGADRGTSISIGYMGESYIDFGQAGMMGVVFAMGLFSGLIYRGFVRSRNAGPLFGMGLASAILYSTAFFDSSITKVMGGLIVALGTAVFLVLLVLPSYLRFARLPQLR
jgi:hypothetical protein